MATLYYVESFKNTRQTTPFVFSPVRYESGFSWAMCAQCSSIDLNAYLSTGQSYGPFEDIYYPYDVPREVTSGTFYICSVGSGVINKTAYSITQKYYSSVSYTSSDVSKGSVSTPGGEFPVGESVTCTATAKSGFKFSRWSDGETEAKRTDVISDNAMSFSAEFVSWNKFTVRFNPNGGTGNVYSQQFVHEVEQNLIPCAFTRSGYVFAGWNTKSDGSGTSYPDGAQGNSISSKDGVTVNLYATWTPTYLVKITNNDYIGNIEVSIYEKDGTDPVATESGGVLQYYCIDGKEYTLKAEIFSKLYEKAYVKTDGERRYLPYTFAVTSTFKHTLNAEAFPLYSITFRSTENGTAIVSTPESPDKEGKYVSQDIVITAIPSVGFMPDKCWIYDVDGRPISSGQFVDSKFELEKNLFSKDISVFATFSRKTYSVSVSSSADEMGTVSGGSDSVPYGDAVTLRATPRDEIAFSFVKWIDAQGTFRSMDNPYTFTATEDVKLVGVFEANEFGTKSLDVSYANGSSVLGTIELDGVKIEGQETKVYDFGVVAKLSARIEPGSKFAGWYFDKACTEIISAHADIEIRIVRDMTVYASFLPNGGSILLWEGLDENKTMTWRSKTYASSRPFNMSSCRVDARGYPIEKLTVDMFSSPDDEADENTGRVELKNIASQNSRRLPCCRCERFMQVEVQSDDEIDAIFIGTSMRGLST